MDLEKVQKELKEKYPGNNIVVIEEGDYQEIICEIESSIDHPERSLAMAVVGRSQPHYHKVSTEVYEVVKGELIISIDGETQILNEGESLEIKPGIVHSAQGNECWFLTHSRPGWQLEDHILVAEDDMD